MKVCLYLELEKQFKGSGIGTAINNQRKGLELNDVPYTNNLKDDFDIIHINIIGLKSFFLAKKLKAKGKKVILHAHATADDFRNSYRYSNLIAPFFQKCLTFYYNQADLVLCPSNYTKGVLKGYGVKRKIEVISNGIDLKKFQFSQEKREKFRKKFSISEDELVTFSVGHVFIRKGIETFVRVAKEFPDRKFLWVGRRYKRLEDPRVTHLIDHLPKNVTLKSFVEDIIEVYSGCDVFFFPSYCENQGIVLLEAGACKKPLLVRNLSTYEGWLEHEKNCLIAKDEEYFSIELKRLLDDSALRENISKSAYEMSKEHSLKKIGAKLKKIYEDLLMEEEH
jgi:1,2-diacylglycerol-3-alpha-glucose alpha-1,2-glucosyltransferase